MILLTGEEAARLSAETLLALRRYTEAGGIVLVRPVSAGSDIAIPVALHDPDAKVDEAGGFPRGVRPGPIVPYDDSLARRLLDRQQQGTRSAAGSRIHARR